MKTKKENKKPVMSCFKSAAAILYVLLVAVFCCGTYWLYYFWNDYIHEERRLHLTELAGTVAEAADLYASSHCKIIEILGTYMEERVCKNEEELVTLLQEQKLLLDVEKVEAYGIDENGIYYKSDGTVGVWENTEHLIQNRDKRRVWIQEVPGEEGNHLLYWVNLDKPLWLEEEDCKILYYAVAIDPFYLETMLVSNAYEERCNIYILANDGTRLYRQRKISAPPIAPNLLEVLEMKMEILRGSWEELRNAVAQEQKCCVEVAFNEEPYYLATAPVAGLPDWNIMVIVASDMLSASADRTIDYEKLSVMISAMFLATLISVAIVTLVYLRNRARLVEQQEESARLLELAAKEAGRANEAKTEFLAHISHDIRTPLNGIMGMTTIAQRSLEEPDKVKDCLDHIQESSDYLLSLVNTVLDLSKIESGGLQLVREPMDLSALLADCVAMLEGQMQEKKLCFQKQFDEFRFPVVLGDALHLRQILMNILGNALKYTPSGGTVTFAVTEKPLEKEQVEYCFTVQDTGIGMDSEFLKRIYLPYTKADEDKGRPYFGTGLGMTIAKKYVDAMQGSISVESEPGCGSTFVIRIVFSIAKEVPEKQDSVTVMDTVSGARLLVAEDVPINLKITVFLLEHMGFVVKTASNGREAVEEFSRSAEGEYAAILMDVMMPEMDGLEATREIRKMKRKDAAVIPIIATTASAFEEERAAMLAAGMNTYLIKPIGEQELFAALQSCIG